jgi:pyrrolidone-carboxylate peptidase
VTIDAEQIAERLATKTPVPVRVSDDAGRFLCNHLAYQILDSQPDCAFMFVHLPAWRPEDGLDALDKIVQTLRLIRAEIKKPLAPREA